VLEGTLDEGISLGRPPRFEGVGPIRVTLDVLHGDSCHESVLLLGPSQLEEVLQALAEIVAIVVEGCVALHLRADIVERLLEHLDEVLLLVPDEVLALGTLLEVALDHGPEGLDRVEFGGVRGHEQEFEVELPGHLTVGDRAVGGVVVEHDVALVDRLQAAAYLDEELAERLGVGALLLAEHRPIQARAYGAYYSDAIAAVLPEDDPHGPVRACPGVRLLQPQVEGGLIEVHDDLVAVSEFG